MIITVENWGASDAPQESFAVKDKTHQEKYTTTRDGLEALIASAVKNEKKYLYNSAIRQVYKEYLKLLNKRLKECK